jgi:hypothetical protein
MAVAPPPELVEGLDQLDDGGEAADPEQVLFQGLDDASATPLPSGSRTKLGELAMPSNFSSRGQSCLVEMRP